MSIIYHNGNFIGDGAIFEFQNRIRLGDGVFDTMLVIINPPTPPLLNQASLHLSRILHNARLVGIGIKRLPSLAELETTARELISRNKIPAGRYALNTLITRGVSERGIMPPDNPTPTITMRLAPVPAQTEFPPINAIISETVRRNEGSPLSQIKSCNYGDNILALLEAKNKGANEAILLNNTGRVTCASAGNIFACLDGNLITPPLSDGVMDGITRRLLIERFSTQEKSLTADDLKNADGLYITNSIRGASALRSLDGQTLPEPSVKIDKDFHLE